MRQVLIIVFSFVLLVCLASVVQAQTLCKAILSLDEGIVYFCPSTENTPEPTLTPEPTPVETSTPSQPLALKDYPLCPTHDASQWHSTIDTVRQCHYDHSHGDDPSTVDDIFGTWMFGDRTISYPHATSVAENYYAQFLSTSAVDTTKKHAGYFYLVRRDLPDSPVSLPNWNTPVHSKIKAFRIQIHFWGEGDTQVRFHSFFYEIQLQDKRTGELGIIRTGGWMDTGILQLYKLQWLPVKGVDPDFATYSNVYWYPGYNDSFGKSIDPYRGYKQTCDQIKERARNANFWSPVFNMGFPFTSMSSDVLWSLGWDVFGYNRIAGASVQKFDNPDCIDSSFVATNPYSSTYTINNICGMLGKPNCRLNGSEVGVFMVFTQVEQSWDQGALDTDPRVGFVSMSTYTDIRQNLVKGCRESSFVCVPLILEHAPVGQGFYQKSGNGKIDISEFDLTPPDHFVRGRWESWHRQ